jgi:aminoglycoside phosphotransferase (APT) family kinase protein
VDSTAPEMPEMRRSSRDPDQLRRDLQRWLAGTVGSGSGARVTDLRATSANGMSSETILFDAAWDDGSGAAGTRELVARIAPGTDDVPVFPTYDLTRQFDVIREVGARTPVPVPPVFWNEPDPDAIGAPFFVMGRVDGLVPPDVMPYTFGDNWLFDASPADQRRLQDASVRVLAELHSLPADDPAFAFLGYDDDLGPTPLARHVAHTREWYEWVVGDGPRSPLIDAGFDWLDRNFPETEGEAVVCWGDSRIGNAMYRDFEPVAILDWEMTCVGPRELDVGWMVYSHQVFEHLATTFELPGMPNFMRPDDVAATYAEVSGHALGDLRWFLAYSAVQFGIVFVRTGQRAVHFGEQEPPANVDDFMHHAGQLADLIAEDL